MSQCAVCECRDFSCAPCKEEACSKQNCYSCCCLESHSQWRRRTIQRGATLQYVSIAWMCVEVIGALTAAILASSFALLAFGSDSVVELASAVVVLKHLNLDGSGSSSQGGRTALFTSLLLVSIVPLIGVGSTYSYFFLHLRPGTSTFGIAIAVGSAIIMPILWFQKRKIGKETGCLPLSIDAMESATCFFMTIALLGGLLGEYFLKLGWLDYAATLVIVAFVAFEARESLMEARENTTLKA